MTTPIDETANTAPETTTPEQSGPTISYNLGDGSQIQVPVRGLAPHVQVLINTIQERKQTIGYLNTLATKLIESNGADAAILQNVFQEIAKSNPELVSKIEVPAETEVPAEA